MLLMLSFLTMFLIALQTIVEPITTFEGLVFAVPILTTFILTQLVKINVQVSDTVKKIIGAVISIGTSYVCWYFAWGLFAALLWWHVAVVGFLGWLVASGFFQLSIAQFILSLLQIGQQKDAYNKALNIKSRFS